jgi:drug/metabolite transporter (DMT)-like permease
VAIGYLPVAIVQWPSHVDPRPLASILVLGTVCTAVAFVVFFALIADVGPARAVVFTYVNPAVAIVLGVIWLNEKFTIGIAVGFPLILLGSILATRRRATRADPSAATAPADPDIITPVEVAPT